MEEGLLLISSTYKTYDALSTKNRTPWTTEFSHNVRMDLPKDRLKQARAAAGYDNPTDAARAHRDLNKNTLISHENGNRPLSRQAAEKYGRAFGVLAGWLLYGENGEIQTSTQRLRDALQAASQLPPEVQDRIADFAEYQINSYEKSKTKETT